MRIKEGFTPLEKPHKRMKRNFLTGFTLIELIIVVIIVGILAAVSMPMMQNMKAKAILSEGVAGIATLRTGFSAYRASGGTENYYGWISTDPVWISQKLGIGPADLDGTYFSQGTYWIETITADFYVVLDFSQNKAPKADETKKIGGSAGYIWIDSTGKFFQYQIPDSGYPTP